MPHHESGLLALRTTDPRIIDRAVKHFVDLAPHPQVEMVRADGGQGVWLCFGSFVDVDVRGFLDAKANAKLAKTLKQPIWVGHAIGGYSNLQTAMAFSAAGKKLWKSEFNFNFPKKQTLEAEDPFTSPERRYEMVKDLRASSGYGRIATEFKLDYFRVLSVDAGDALFAKDKKELGKKGAGEHSKWLESKYVSPEGEPGDGAVPPSAQDHVAYRFLGAIDLKELAGVIAHLAAHRKARKDSVTLRVSASKNEAVVLVEGAGVRALSTTLISDGFARMLGAIGGMSLISYGWDEGEAPQPRAGLGLGSGVLQFMRAQREPLPMKLKFKPQPLAVSAALAKKIDRLRQALIEQEQYD